MKFILFLALIMIVGSVMASAGEQLATKVPDLAQLQKMTARFAPTEFNVDISSFPNGDRKALVKLVEAARLINDIFMMQYWSGDARSTPSCRKNDAAGQSAPALLLDQQGPVVGARRQHRLHSRRARAQAAGRELLSREP